MEEIKVDTQPTKQPKPKKPIYKKWWFWVIIVVLLFGGVGSSSNDKDKKSDEKAKTEVTEEKKEEPKAETKKVWTDDEILEYTNEHFKDVGGHFEKYDEGSFVYYADGDIASALELLVYDYTIDGKISDENKQAYNDFIEAFKTISTTLDTATNKANMLNVANPKNTENVLFSFIGGTVVYNAFEE